jgi:hypothetical protein
MTVYHQPFSCTRAPEPLSRPIRLCHTSPNKKIIIKILFYLNTPMLASGIKGMRIQLRFGSELPGSAFMRRRLGCPVCLQRGAPPRFHFFKKKLRFRSSFHYFYPFEFDPFLDLGFGRTAHIHCVPCCHPLGIVYAANS